MMRLIVIILCVVGLSVVILIVNFLTVVMQSVVGRSGVILIVFILSLMVQIVITQSVVMLTIEPNWKAPSSAKSRLNDDIICDAVYVKQKKSILILDN